MVVIIIFGLLDMLLNMLHHVKCGTVLNKENRYPINVVSNRTTKRRWTGGDRLCIYLGSSMRVLSLTMAAANTGGRNTGAGLSPIAGRRESRNF